MTPVSAPAQHAALDALLETLAPSELAVPSEVLSLIPPRPAGYGHHRELFPRLTGPTFDALSPAVVAATMTVAQLLDPARATRLVEQYALDESQLGLDELIDRLVRTTFDSADATGYRRAISRIVQRVVVEGLMELADHAPLGEVRAKATMHLDTLTTDLALVGNDAAEEAHRRLLAQDIQRHFSRPASDRPSFSHPSAPPGSPIGDPALEWLAGHARWCDWNH